MSIDHPTPRNGKSHATVKPKAKAPKTARATLPPQSAPVTPSGTPIVARRYTRPGTDPLAEVTYEKRDAVISNPDGSVVFACRGAEIPRSWSQLATDIAVSKYFRRAGLHGDAEQGESSVRQLVYRVARSIREAGESRGYFTEASEADSFEAELSFLLVHQYGAFNSPVWFNCGLFQRYDIAGQGGNWAWDETTETETETKNAYERPQCSACFIQAAQDDLMAIFELVRNEARLFKYGSGCTSGDSRIYVEGEGFLPIRDVFRRHEAEGRPVQDFDGKGRYIDVSDLELRTLSMDPRTGVFSTDRIDRVWSYDVAADDKLTVRFDNGARAVVSAWHPFLVWDGERVVERRADALGRGDTVLGPNETALRGVATRAAEVNYGTRYFGHDEERCVAINPDLAWLCGYFMGDGSLGENRARTTNKKGKTYSYDGLRLRFHDETVVVLERVVAIVAREFGETGTIQADGRGSKGHTVAFTGRKATGFFAALFAPGPKSYTLAMPEFVWEGGRDLALAFLAGLVDSDGHVAEGRAKYTTASREFAKDVGVLASLYGLGGGAMQDDTVHTVTVVHRHVEGEARAEFAAGMTHPERRRRLTEYAHDAHERKFCMPLSAGLAAELFGERRPAEWLAAPVGETTVPLGRLKYEGLINPLKLLRCLQSLGRTDALGTMLARVARSALFVASVEPCAGDPDFYDLTVASRNNYLAGEAGLVVIHNTGSNFSALRGRQEKLSGGGTSSGLMSFLEVFDRAAGSTKSGGTTRRAAKMVCLDMDHPEIVDFVQWKQREEKKAHALIAAGYPSDFNGEAYHTVSGQNSNNSVRVTDAFMRAVENDGEWSTRMRTTGEVCETFRARDLWRKVAEAAWSCADPGVQYDSTINDWHTSSNTGRIYASNPCVTGDTLVATAEGLRRIRELVGEVPVLTTPEGNRRATRVWKTGHKPVYRLTTRAGFSLRLTADHPVWTANRGDVAAAELCKGDVVRLVGSGFGSTRLQTKLAEAIGYAVGDGCVAEQTQGNRMLNLAGGEDDRAVLGSFCEWVNEVAADAGDGRTARRSNVRETQTGITFVTSKPHVVNEFTRFAVLDRGSENKRFTDAVFGLDRDAQAALLRGLFTADGTAVEAGEKGRYVGLDSCSLELLRQVQTMLLAFGVKAKLYTDRRLVDRAMLPDGHGGMKEYPVQQMHSLRVTRSSRVVFERAIGFCVESPKAARLAAFGAYRAYTDTLTDEVVSLVADGEEDVYDLTEPSTSHFVANGIVVHNCSEYMFLDDSACNLSSLNLTKFITETPDGRMGFDVEGYRHAARVLFLAQEILVDFSSYPTKDIGQNSHDYRPLGLGYANLGTLLMLMGVAYDSDAGRSIAAALTAIMTGHAYRVSAEVAAHKGAFAGFAKNREPMLRVMNKHRDAAYSIDARHCPSELLRAAQEDWDEAVRLGERHGYRNSQATVLAPTGTIGLLMDCDTTGIEPDFALVKFKKLAGGGYFKIVNASVERALQRLGYSRAQITEILAWVVGSGTFVGAPHLSREQLKAKGFTADDIARVEAGLPGAFTIEQAFSPHTLGADLLQRLGLTEAALQPGFSLLQRWGMTRAELDSLGDHVLGRMTVEGAPHLRDEHLPVFDCANRCGKHGRRYLAPMSHVKMMAAVQPFLSGAISKTVNLPKEATVDEVMDVYYQGWKLGLKAVALYRDGCKASQPLSTSGEKRDDGAKAQKPALPALPAVAETSLATVNPPGVPTGTADSAAEYGPLFSKNPVLSPTRATVRHRLPKKRRGFTQEAAIAGHKVFLRTGEYEDGQLGEIFIDMHKEGAAFRSLMNSFAIAVSLGLQHGVPLAEFVDQFTFTRFEPQGAVQGHPNIKFATSIVDYVFRVLGVEYNRRYDLAHVPPENEEIGRPEEARPIITTAPQAALSATTHGGGEDSSALDLHLGKMMGDAPFCDNCGHITVRNGACYRCLNCGSSMGCS